MTKSKETKVHVMNDDSIGTKPNYSKVDKVYVTNPSEGGGGVADEVAWENVTGKPSSFPPAEHNHDDRYNTKEDVQDIIDFTRGQMKAEQGKVMAHADDEPAYLDSKVDNVTAVVEGNELKVKSIDGLTIGVASINSWLSGTEDNIQTQIDSINDSLVALSSGMRYIGKQETYADLQNVSNTENGDLAVVLADENRSGGRSMYVYSDNFGMWEFIGEFTFTDEFLALQDTPDSYAGADGKVVKVAGERLVFDDVDYGSLKNRPSSTITDIDDAVVKRHEHSNADSLSKLGVNERGELTINGVVYVPKIEPEPKEILFAYLSNTVTVAEDNFIPFNSVKPLSNIPHDTETGIFTLTPGKSYRVTVTLMGDISKYITIYFMRQSTKVKSYPYGVIYGATSGITARGSSGVLDAAFTINESSDGKYGILLGDAGTGLTEVELYGNRGSLLVQEI